MVALKILPDTKGTGTPFGSSYHSTSLVCPKMLMLDTLNRVEGGPVAPHFAVGTMFHSYARQYHHPDPEAVLDLTVDAFTEPEHLEALRLYNAYRGKVGREEWGTTITSERPFPLNEAERLRLDAAGFSECTGQPDLVTNVTEEKADEILAKWKLMLPPGNYHVDYKTAAARTDAHFWKQAHGTQYPYYMMCWNTAVLDTPVIGTIVVHIFKLKEVDVRATFVPYPDAKTQAMIHGWLKMGRFMRNENTGAAVPSACASGFSVCKYAGKQCNRLPASAAEIEEYNNKRVKWEAVCQSWES